MVNKLGENCLGKGYLSMLPFAVLQRKYATGIDVHREGVRWVRPPPSTLKILGPPPPPPFLNFIRIFRNSSPIIKFVRKHSPGHQIFRNLPPVIKFLGIPPPVITFEIRFLKKRSSLFPPPKMSSAHGYGREKRRPVVHH